MNTLKRVIDHIIILNKAGCLFVFPTRFAQQRLWSCFLLRNVSIHLFILCLLIRPALHSCVRVSTLGVTVQGLRGRKGGGATRHAAWSPRSLLQVRKFHICSDGWSWLLSPDHTRWDHCLLDSCVTNVAWNLKLISRSWWLFGAKCFTRQWRKRTFDGRR